MPARLHRFAKGKHGRRKAHRDENDDEGGRSHRRGRMQNDAERAVIGGGLHRMHVRYLDESEQGEQDKAQNRLRVHVAMPAGLEPRTCQRGDHVTLRYTT